MSRTVTEKVGAADGNARRAFELHRQLRQMKQGEQQVHDRHEQLDHDDLRIDRHGSSPALQLAGPLHAGRNMAHDARCQGTHHVFRPGHIPDDPSGRDLRGPETHAPRFRVSLSAIYSLITIAD